MPRRDSDDDNDFPRRPSRRRDLDDDRPRARPRRRQDDEDDYDDRPHRRSSAASSNNSVFVTILAIGGFLVVAMLAVGGFLLFRTAKPPAAPSQPPQVAGGNPQPVFVPPGTPQNVIPDEIATECIISNLRLEGAGLGGRFALTFDYEFPGGRPFGGDRFVVIVTEPGKAPSQANLNGFMAAKDKVVLDRFGGIGNYARGTTVYMTKGFNNKRISNVLTLQ